MNNTGNKRSGYLVALLLVVGLAAFSNSMRELADIHRFTLDTGRLVAQYIAPAEVPQIPPQMNIAAKLNSCERRQAVPVVEVQWLEDVEGIAEPGAQATVPAPRVKIVRVAPRTPAKPTELQLAKVEKFAKFDFHAAPFEFKIATDDNDDSETPAQLPLTMFKAKTRKHNEFKLSTRDRELILRTLNRSINLRTAS